MKFAVHSIFICVLIAGLIPVSAATVAYWDFNSPAPDANPTTGTFAPVKGDGTARVINANHTFRDSTSGLDAGLTDNSCVRMNGFPAAEASNKTAGIEFRLSTVGFKGLTLRYDHNNGDTGSRYYRVQYTIDGMTWVDHRVITNAAAGWFVYSVDFTSISAADNNPNFGVRLVSEFQSTATGTGPAAYAASQTPAVYNTAGTWWVDRVIFSAQTRKHETERLRILTSQTGTEISWGPVQGRLEQTSSLPGAWQPVANNSTLTNGRTVMRLPMGEVPQYYRLRQGTFRAMSYNIHHGAGTDGVLDLARIASVINAQAPDIVGLQEVDRYTRRSGFVDQMAELGRLTGMFHFFGKNINYDLGEYGLGVLSKFPIKSKKHTLYLRQNTSLEQRGVNILQIDFGETDVYFFNTHLDHTTSDAERLYQIRQIRTLVRSYPAKKVLFCGDFNFRPTSDCYTLMMLGFDDAWPRASNGAGYTFPSTGPNRRIDYFWTRSPEITPVQAWIPSSLASDHLPVVMNFLLPAAD
jgi:endonuclease/exonuclease/phosphatase family metal-dependent hydrolase